MCPNIFYRIDFYFFQQFQKHTEHANFSNSVVDVFNQLTQCLEVLLKLECHDSEIWKRYMKRFAKTVVKVLTEYSSVLQADFPNHVRDESKVSLIIEKNRTKPLPHFQSHKINK